MIHPLIFDLDDILYSKSDFKELSASYRMGIITDGLPEVQEREVRALQLEKLMDYIIYTWVYGEARQKPHSHSFELMLQSLELAAENAFYVGDNPSKDCIGARRAGIKYAQIRPHVSEKKSLTIPVSKSRIMSSNPCLSFLSFCRN